MGGGCTHIINFNTELKYLNIVHNPPSTHQPIHQSTYHKSSKIPELSQLGQDLFYFSQLQGSHSIWKNESRPGKPGNVIEF